MSDKSLISISGAVAVTGAVVVGAGFGILLYQQHKLRSSQLELLSEVRRLSASVARLETEMKKNLLLAASASSEELEEIFLDASEADPVLIHSNMERIPPEGGLNGPGVLEKVFTQVDQQLSDGGQENLVAANNTLKQLVKNGSRGATVYWRLAKSFFLLASDDLLDNPSNDGSEHQKVLMKKAFEAAELAIKADSHCGEAYKWLAIIRGSITQYLPIQEQIKSAYDIKENITTSIKYNPKDSLSYHMLGRWCFSVYSLSWLERRVAATLFATPPTATLEEAMEAFLKAEECAPKESIDNCLYLAKCYISKKDYYEALYWLQEALKIKESSRDDIKALEEARTLLSQYQSYA